MNRRRIQTILKFILSISLSGILPVSCNNNSFSGKIIITRSPGNLQETNPLSGDSWRYPGQAQIVLVGREKQDGEPLILTKDFYSACAPDISYDGRFMLFAGQAKNSDPWRIWELNLGNSKTRLVSPAGGNCTDPVYLPGNRLVFSMSIENDSLRAGHSLYTCNLDGTGLARITFNPATYLASGVMNDGRILTTGTELYPEKGSQLLMVMRPDGTKSDMFYNPAGNGFIYSRVRETTDGRITFIESAKGTGKDGIPAAISYNRPLYSHSLLSHGSAGSYISVFPSRSGNWLVCFRRSVAEKYGLYEFDPEKRTIAKPLYESKDYDIIDAIVAEEHPRPKKLPSEVDMHVKSGLLLCQDINLLNMNDKGNKKMTGKAVRVEILGLNKSLGIVNVEEDGSFYLKPLSDTPFRIRTLDENGKIVSGPCSWICLRPNERRGCVGCHEDPELSPENRIPFSVKKNPVIIPVHIDKVKEKKVELE